jgi:hypothetical protein
VVIEMEPAGVERVLSAVFGRLIRQRISNHLRMRSGGICTKRADKEGEHDQEARQCRESSARAFADTHALSSLF